ncbi:TonB C-terminal domain-containing protein [Sulfurimonas sp. HSL-1716]|uniref:TonB C-terminal domain-containing protein n=1 Tax=Hydrocurvibacter sulfurireducens TaxID=3131937 RepID=UPI0031F857B6
MSSVILLLVFILFSYVLFSSQQIKSYALQKNDAITVSIVMQTRPVNESKKNNSDQIEKNEAPKDVSSLFSSVWTKSVDKISEKKADSIDKNQLLRLTKKIKRSSKNDVESIKEKVENTKFAKADVQVTSDEGSSGQEVNEFLAKIQGEIYNNFFPPQNTQGQSAKVLIRLGADGTVLDFIILSYSADETFNGEVDRLKNRIDMLKFPENPENRSGSYTIILKAKE